MKVRYGTFIIIAVLFCSGYVFGQTDTTETTDVQVKLEGKVAILPFQSLGIDYVSAQTAELLLRQEIGKLSDMEIFSETETRQMTGDTPCAAAACAVDIGKRLGADYSVFCSLSRLGEKIVVQYGLVDVVSDKRLIMDNTTSDTIEDLEDFEAYLSFDEKKVKQAFSDSSISTHFIYLTKTTGTDLVNQEGVSVTSRGLLDTTSPTIPIKETQDLSASFFSAFMEIAQTTGGTTDSSANAASSFKKAVDAAENYYLLYYRPSNYKEDGKFKSIEVKVRGKNYRVTHRAGYFAEKVDSSRPVTKESKPVKKETNKKKKRYSMVGQKYMYRLSSMRWILPN